MSEIEKATAQSDAPQTFDIASIFNKKADIEFIEDVEPIADKQPPIKKPPQPRKQPPVVEDDEDEEDIPKGSTSKSEAKPTEIDYKAEFEKSQKTLKDTQKSFHEDRKKLSAYKKAVEKLKEEGSLLDEEATSLLDHTQFEDSPQEETIFIKYAKIWDKELEYMKKYAPNPQEINQQILAFQHFMQTAPQDEVQDVLSDLAQYEDDEVEFTKQMLEIGRQYNDDIYSDIAESGSIRKLKTKYAEKEAEMQKEIDKWKKRHDKLKDKYEDFNTEPSNYRLPSGSGNIDLPKDATMDPKAIFAKQWQKR